MFLITSNIKVLLLNYRIYYKTDSFILKEVKFFLVNNYFLIFKKLTILRDEIYFIGVCF